MNSVVAVFFMILLVLYFSFTVLLFTVGRIQKKKGLFYLYLSFFFRGLLSVGPALLMFHADISWTAYLTGPLRVSLIPLTYLYLEKLSEQDKRIRKKDLWHFIPLFVNIVLALILVPGHASDIVGQSDETLKSSVRMIWEDSPRHNILAVTCRVFLFLQAFIYPFLIYRLYKSYIKTIKNNSSLLKNTNAVWIRWVVFMMPFEVFFEGFGLLGIYNSSIVLVLFYIFTIFYAFFFFIHALQQGELSTSFSQQGSSVMDKGDIQFVKTSAKEDEFNEILEKFLENESYLKPELSFKELADNLNISKNKLSQIIKEQGSENFYMFVNYFRIERSKQLLTELPDNYVIESVISKSGFKARSTFYRVFKEIAGETPTNYLEKVNKKTQRR
ncbi:helix-turn-helix domain-containing protein [Maribellus comscasis]|uniref:Helix-turn-helix domain-containing protein n=1 Tax=Maribellus comscasis TaxID=2681766 RepID=A0A6I6JT88_9BACT|nr:helix-turn-helix domain-containing protein [Maribellus comscasis]QGY46255.1 helix-turn-helix domain-containing protein [Maribellus comscasis]